MILAQPCQPATKADLGIASDLRDTLQANADRCVGMGANMIGVTKQVIIAQVGPFPIIMFNPTIVKKQGPYQTKEGCLSLPGQRPVTRYQKIQVRFRNENWQKQELSLEGFSAEIVQHEVDHCHGILI
jgi:peptide deformylase